MEKTTRLFVLTLFGSVLLLTGCEEMTGLTPSSGSSIGSSTRNTPAAIEEHLSRHDIALRFLTAFIRLDRSMALRYATPEAVSKLNWNMSHRGNIPYYDDKMLLQFNGGWARVFFEDTGKTCRISDFEVHQR